MAGDFVVAEAQARAGTYRLLARLTLAEVDADLVEALREMPIFGPALAESGGPEALQALRVEYARAFLMSVHPYESVYLDESAMLNTPRSAALLEHYREHGFEPDALRSVGAPDHLGLELEFMAHLVEREAVALRAGHLLVAAELRDEQRHLLDEHLLRWAPIFGRLLAETVASPLYRTLGEALEVFVLGDQAALARAAGG